MRDILNTAIVVIVLLVSYHFALNHFAGSKFKVFNYQIKITECGPRVVDRIETIEKQVKPEAKK